ncbi:hypothetical protein BACUNI_00084 [Bacteroides uniformis ATCC 8492]|uniref:Uncharacterized protein n=1 Tax=Bacteroides uniformis (strain ATCC 8492 / DSM 6597 / CCUG 4942 / CIP 103695 / JCM 5828 / KCTC 5204 / NCTC 13054 / VPI 0061) TaxID=411479 RepID=A0ABC9NHQ7_BACUC|nr:hypothetical protein BACUNI_00084 [Bacteroides uniformis ATCC 8492]
MRRLIWSYGEKRLNRLFPYIKIKILLPDNGQEGFVFRIAPM